MTIALSVIRHIDALERIAAIRDPFRRGQAMARMMRLPR